MPVLVYNDDGWSTYMRYPAPMAPEDIARVTVGALAGTGVGVYQFCALGGHAVNYASTFLPRVGAAMGNPGTLHVWRMCRTLAHLESLGTDPLHVVADACHDADIACQFSLRMNDAHHTYLLPDGSPYFPELQSPWFGAHADALLENGQLDYSHPDVHAYRVAQVAEILDRYDVDGIDLDFTRSRPWFRPGEEDAGRPLMTTLIERIRRLTDRQSKSLSVRLEYDPDASIDSGLDIEGWLREGLFDQVTLGGVGDHTPDAPSDWFVELAHASGAKVYPGIEGQLHWLPGPGAGGTGLRPGRGVLDGFGPPSIEYLRAVAALHYMDHADGLSLFNFTCADGPFAVGAFRELVDPEGLALRDKQYVAAVWPWDAAIFQTPWVSRFRLDPGRGQAVYPLRLADDFDEAERLGVAPESTLWLDLMGVNNPDDIEVRLNGTRLEWTGDSYNHWDHGCWNDLLTYDVPAEALQQGESALELRRRRGPDHFPGTVQVRRLVLDVTYPRTFAPGRGRV